MSRTSDLKSIVEHALERVDPQDARERASLERMRAELVALERPFERDGGPVHFTASAVVIGKEGTLLHLHKKLGIWLQPGGHIDPGETPWEAALREVAEETGLRGALVSPPWKHEESHAVAIPTATSMPLSVPSFPRLLHVDVHPAGNHVHLDLRYLVAASGPPSPPPDESQDVAWFAWDDALARADPGLIGALRVTRRWLPDLGLSLEE